MQKEVQFLFVDSNKVQGEWYINIAARATIVIKAIHCKKSDFLFVKSTGEMLRVKSEMYFLV